MSNRDLFGNEIEEDELLRDKFLEPPFSVLDTRQGDWQARKRKWKSLGIKSEVGREEGLTFTGTAAEFDHYRVKEGKRSSTDEQSTSIFDPALTELMYRWYAPEGGRILDPFAGGSVRGIVAAYLGYEYTGIELRPEQVESNLQQVHELLGEDHPEPEYFVGDAYSVLRGPLSDREFDLIFTCPPYHDLEVYSELPRDISNMSYEHYLIHLDSIMHSAYSKLSSGGYAVVVLGDVRDPQGYYRNLIGDFKYIMLQHGAKLLNEAVLLNVVASAAMRAARVFEAGKKLTKIHQNVLIFENHL